MEVGERPTRFPTSHRPPPTGTSLNASYNWLRAFVAFEQSPAELRDLVTMHTATVDDLVDLRADLAPIVGDGQP